MRVLLSYKFSGENAEEVRALLIPAQTALQEMGHEVYAILFDTELRTPENLARFKPKDYMFHAFSKLKDIDAVVVLLASSEKSKGMLIEIGYALARGIRVVVAQKNNISGSYLSSLAAHSFERSSFEELAMHIKALDFSTLTPRTF